MVSMKGRAVLIGMMIGLMPEPGRAVGAPQFTAEEKAWIAAHPVVRTRADRTWRPFVYLDNGKIVGIVPSFLDAVSRISGLRFEYVDGISWRDSSDALRSGRIDLAPAVTWRNAVDPREGRNPSAAPDAAANGAIGWSGSDVIVSRPYLVGTIFVVAPEWLPLIGDAGKLAGRRVAIKGGGALEAAIRQRGTAVTLLTYDDERDALAAVADGDADVAVGPDLSILPLLRRQFYDRLFVAGGLPEGPYALALATRRDTAVLASILDKSLAAIPAREIESITRQWSESADYGKPSLRSILYYRRWQVAAAGTAVLALAAIALLSWRSRVAAVRSERDKAMFVAFISHEIRTPMHTILSSLELLQRSKLPPKLTSRADAAVAASESLLTLLDDILEYSRLESHNVTLALEPTPVVPWAQHCADMVRWRVDEKQLDLAVELACARTLCVLIDPARTRQIVLNLLVNAIKFTSAGSIALRVDYLDVKPDQLGSLVIEVRDTGIGISPESQRRIFEPYQRVEQAGNRRVAGSGLGLSICRELVELMEGVITVSSNPDKGTIFTVILPARHIVHTPATGMIGTPFESDLRQPAGNGPMILVVDDHEAVRHAIEHQLDALACGSTMADTGEHALAQFERATFDMVLLDCDLPDVDGYTVVQRMRDIERDQNRARTPIVAISASTGDAHRARCFDSGMDGVLGKPLRLDALHQMINLWCPTADADEPVPPVPDRQPAKADFGTIYRQSVDADLAALDDALSNDDADRARHAAHRLKGAAAIAGHTATSERAAELERRLQFASGGMPPSVRALCDELVRLHRADMAGSNAGARQSGDTGA